MLQNKVSSVALSVSAPRGDKPWRYGDATLEKDGLLVFGVIPYGAIYLKFIYPIGNRNGLGRCNIFGKPTLDKRSLKLTAEQLGSNNSNICVNFGAFLHWEDASEVVALYDKVCGTNYLEDLQLYLNRHNAVFQLTQYPDIRALIMAQIYPVFEELFDIDYYAFSSMSAKPLFDFVQELFTAGLQITFFPRIFNTMLGFVGKFYSNKQSFRRDDDKQDILVRLTTKRVRLILAKERAAIDKAAAGGADDDDDDDDAHEPPSKITRFGAKNTSAALTNFFSAKRGDEESIARGSSSSSSSSSSAAVNITGNVLYRGKPMTYMSTDPRKCRCPMPSALAIPPDAYLDALVYEHLEALYLGESHMCVSADTIAAFANATTESENGASMTVDQCWQAIVRLVRGRHVLITDIMDTSNVNVSPEKFATVELAAEYLQHEDRVDYMRVGLHHVTKCERTLYESMGEFITKAEAVVELHNCDLLVNGLDLQPFVSLRPEVQKKMADEYLTADEFAAEYPDVPMRIELAPEQEKAIVRAITSSVVTISGAGGTGKSEIMSILYRYIRTCYPNNACDIGFFCFKNNSVDITTRTIGAIRQANDDFKGKDYFATIDSLLYPSDGGGGDTAAGVIGRVVGALANNNNNSSNGLNAMDGLGALKKGECKADKIRVEWVIIDEAGMLNTLHYSRLLKKMTATGVMRHIVCFGDEKQLPPISPGNAFLHIVESLPTTNVRLVKNFRAKTPSITLCLQAIREKKADEVVFDNNLEVDDQFCIFDASVPDDVRTKETVMHDYGETVMQQVATIDPDRTRYADIMIVCPFNDMSKYLSILMTQRYFGINKWSREQLHRYAVGNKKNGDILAGPSDPDKDKEQQILPTICVGMRVACEVTRKDEGIASGRVGIVTHIFDKPFTKGEVIKNKADVLALAVANRHRWLKTATDAPLDGDKGRRIVIIDSDTIVAFESIKMLHATISPADCRTVHRSQGYQAPNVIAVLPNSINLADNCVVYTAASRAMVKLVIIGTPGQLQKMITTSPPRKESLLSFGFQDKLPHNCIADQAHIADKLLEGMVKEKAGKSKDEESEEAE